MIEFLKKIENKYDVNSIKVEGIPIWGFLRTPIYVAYGNKYLNMVWASQKSIVPSYLKIIKTIFLSLFVVFRKHKYFFLSESNERKIINTKYFDKLCDGIIDVLDQKECLLSEHSVKGKIHCIKDVYTKNFISSYLFYYVTKLIPISSFKIEGEEILNQILIDHKLNVDYRKRVITFLKFRKLSIFFLKLWKTNAVFVKCYYSPLNQGFISAANSLGIKTIELQHGIISENHPSYKIFTNLDKNVFPRWILTNGVIEKNILLNSDHKIYSKVIPVGNYYLEKIKKKSPIPFELIEPKKRFHRIVAVTLQDTVEDITISFIKEVALMDNKILYLIIPRNYSDKYEYLRTLDNILINEKLNFYEIIPHVDFHSTVYSTCALESVYFGIPNILLDFDNKSSDFFNNILKRGTSNVYINDTIQFLNAVNRLDTISKENIMEAHQDICSSNYKNNIENVKKLIFDAKI